MLDVQNFYPSVRRPALETAIGSLSVPSRTFEGLLDWFDHLAGRGVEGLPTGHDPSRVLANGLLMRGDMVFTLGGVPYVRYVDDTWSFVHTPDRFLDLVDEYETTLQRLDLTLNRDKTQWYTGDEAIDVMTNLALAYVIDVMRVGGPEGRAAALDLFEHALEDPGNEKSALRYAIDKLGGWQDPRPLHALQDDIELLRYAPDQWISYLRTMRDNKKTRHLVSDDWLVTQAVEAGSEDHLYRRIIFLRAVGVRRLSKELGREVLDLATTDGTRTEPARVWAADVWGKSEAYRPGKAIDVVEDRGGYSTKRAFAMTLTTSRGTKHFPKYIDQLRRLDHELEPTVAWLEAD